MVTWIVVAIVVLAFIVGAVAVLSLLGRLSGLRRAGLRLQRRQAEVLVLQEKAQGMEQTVAGLQERAERMQDQLMLIKAGRGDADEGHAFLR